MKTNWKTTVGGVMTSAGASLMGAAQFDWMTPREKHTALLIGFVCTVVGPIILGLNSRDKNLSDQDVGLRPEPTADKPSVTVVTKTDEDKPDTTSIEVKP